METKRSSRRSHAKQRHPDRACFADRYRPERVKHEKTQRTAFAAPQEIALAPQAYAGPPPDAKPASPGVQSPSEGESKAADPGRHLVKSPIVGTFYDSPSPDSAPFVRVGERVQPGKVLCIIESMKLMNEIEAESSGILESKLVMNGQPVEYGEALFAIRAV